MGQSVTPPTSSDFQQALGRVLRAAQLQGLAYIDVLSGDLHRELGGYPGTGNRMPVCCDVMRRNMQAGDVILYTPPKGRGATLKIRYQLPR